MQLFKEHLGLLNCSQDQYHEDLIVMDPLDNEFYNEIWCKTAQKNTLIYRDVFRCVPDDTGNNKSALQSRLKMVLIFLF